MSYFMLGGKILVLVLYEEYGVTVTFLFCFGGTRSVYTFFKNFFEKFEALAFSEYYATEVKAFYLLNTLPRKVIFIKTVIV